jgi:hypothetical protein
MEFAGVFFVFGIISILGFIVSFFMTETRGRVFEGVSP